MRKPKITFTYGNFAVEGFDSDGTVATFIGPAAGAAGKQYVDWLAHTPGTELEDLRVAVNEIDGALCNYCNQEWATHTIRHPTGTSPASTPSNVSARPTILGTRTTIPLARFR